MLSATLNGVIELPVRITGRGPAAPRSAAPCRISTVLLTLYVPASAMTVSPVTAAPAA